MKLLFVCVVTFASVSALWAQSSLGSGSSPTEVVDQLWRKATAGELLTRQGWNGTSRFFVQDAPFPGDGIVRIVSNYWGIEHSSVNDKTAEVDGEYWDAGRIDSSLRYSEAPQTPFYKTNLVFHLVFSPTHLAMFKSDGKTITGKEDRPGPMEWQIKDAPGVPWTTINTAIRYVLEMRGKTSDPVVMKNADRTLAKLLLLH
jgi:hypothetical protein